MSLDVAIEVCTSCSLFHIPTCPDHSSLLVPGTGPDADTSTGRGPKAFYDLHGFCPAPRCKTCTRDSTRSCSACSHPLRSGRLVIPMEELDYGITGLSGVTGTIEHSMLVCEGCRAMGFPGSSNVLCTRTASNPIVDHHGNSHNVSNYRLPHSSDCTGQSVVPVPVVISSKPLTAAKASFPVTNRLLADLRARAAAQAELEGQREYLARRMLPAASNTSGGMKELGLRFFAGFVRRLSPSHPKAAGKPLRDLADMLCSQASSGAFLFPDWSPPREAPAVVATLTPDSVSASSSEGHNEPAKALAAATGMWKATHAAESSTWTADLEAASTLSFVELGFETASTKLTPESFTVAVLAPGSGTFSEVASVKTVEAFHRVMFTKPVLAQRVQVTLKGYHTKNTDKYHGITSVAFYTPVGAGSHIVATSCLGNLQTWMGGVMAQSALPEDQCQAFRGLLGLLKSSGSLNMLLTVCEQTLLKANGALQSSLEAEAHDLLGMLHRKATDEHEALALADLRVASGGGGSSGGMVAVDAKFELDVPSGSNSRVTLHTADTYAHSDSGSHSVVFINQGPFTSGKASWEIKLVEDTNSQCTCFGLATKPVSNCNYERSTDLWMYRAYNGYRYSRGTCARPSSSDDTVKIKKGETVRCELDMDEGVMKLSIEGRDMGVVFSGLSAYEVYPCVQFYSSGRTVELVSFKMEAGGGGTAAAAVGLDELQEQLVRVGYGAFGKAGNLGYSAGGSSSVMVGGKGAGSAISMHPPHGIAAVDDEGEDGDEAREATVTYFLKKQYDLFTGSVALDDNVDTSKLQQDGSPVTFQILLDGDVAWTSDPVQAPREVQSFSVSVLEREELRLRVWVEGMASNAHAVWVSPTLTECGPWTCDGWTNDKSSFVCALTGTRRGQAPPLPALSLSPSSLHDFATATLEHAGLLADQYTKAMRKPGPHVGAGVSSWDLESPYSVEVSGASFGRLARLIQQATAGSLPSTAMMPLLHLARANVRRLVVSRVDPCVAGLDAETEAKDDESKSDDDQVAGRVPHTVAALAQALERVSLSGAVDPAARALAQDILSSSSMLLMPDVADRAEQFGRLVPGHGVVEMQFDFPCTAVGPKNASVPVDTLLLTLQIECKKAGWKTKIVGRWPAKVFLVVDVPAGATVAGFLSDGIFTAALDRVGVQGWTFPDGLLLPVLPLSVQTSADWDRRAQLPYELGFGAIRAYPNHAATFEDVVSSVKGLLPPVGGRLSA